MQSLGAHADARSVLRPFIQIRLADFGNGQRAGAEFVSGHALCLAEGEVEGAERTAPEARRKIAVVLLTRLERNCALASGAFLAVLQ
jgi:hypothetical protein